MKAGFQAQGDERSAGFTLVELLITTAIGAVLILSLTNVVSLTLAASDDSQERNRLAGEARFGMGRMVRAVGRTSLLILPLAEDPSTVYSEALRDPGVLAIALDPRLDRDLDGIADADNDGDGQVDEDLGNDASNDNEPGLVDIDDNNDGLIDVSAAGKDDDDESGLLADEDPRNGLDDDGDGSIDEDAADDMNDDGAPGLAFVDDDGDTNIDEGSPRDDDEDGLNDEDWIDAVVYYVSGTDLVERFPDLNPGDGGDFTETVIAENVQSFRVERLPRGPNRSDLVEISLGIESEKVSVFVRQQVRVGGAP